MGGDDDGGRQGEWPDFDADRAWIPIGQGTTALALGFVGERLDR